MTDQTISWRIDIVGTELPHPNFTLTCFGQDGNVTFCCSMSTFPCWAFEALGRLDCVNLGSHSSSSKKSVGKFLGLWIVNVHIRVWRKE